MASLSPDVDLPAVPVHIVLDVPADLHAVAVERTVQLPPGEVVPGAVVVHLSTGSTGVAPEETCPLLEPESVCYLSQPSYDINTRLMPDKAPY